jgi:type II secretory pathway pseudopilin PulG
MPNIHPRSLKTAVTLTELLVIISIISVLAGIVAASVNGVREQGKVASAVSTVRQLKVAISAFYADTNTLPGICDLACTASNDPLINANGVGGWKGPYLPGGEWNLKAPWGGHISAQNLNLDLDGDGSKDEVIKLDDDAPGSNSNDNTGAIPMDAMLKIDKALDDGNLSTGKMRGNGNSNDAATFFTAPGELIFIANP